MQTEKCKNELHLVSVIKKIQCKGIIKYMEKFKSGFVSIIGRTNVGKSTLLNMLTGQKIAAVVNKSQTTRTAIKAIINRENSQIIFIDTPGIHKPKTKLSEIMIDTAYSLISDSDIVLFIIDASSTEIKKGDKIILDKIKSQNKKTILIINKIDLIEKENILKLIEMYKDEYEFEAVIPICAKDDKYTEIIIREIEKHLPTGPKYYQNDEVTDQTMRQLTEEIIREKALMCLDEEIPHGIYVEVENFKSRKTKNDEPIFNIDSTIYCLRDSHKGIIIGKNGQMLKKIGQSSRYELEKILQKKINLKIWVKVNPDWQNNQNFVNKFKI